MSENLHHDGAEPRPSEAVADMVNGVFRDLAFHEPGDEGETAKVYRELGISPVLGAAACRNCPLCDKGLKHPPPDEIL